MITRTDEYDFAHGMFDAAMSGSIFQKQNDRLEFINIPNSTRTAILEFGRMILSTIGSLTKELAPIVGEDYTYYIIGKQYQYSSIYGHYSIALAPVAFYAEKHQFPPRFIDMGEQLIWIFLHNIATRGSYMRLVTDSIALNTVTDNTGYAEQQTIYPLR